MIGDRLRGFFGDVKDKFKSIGERISGRVEDARKTIGETIRRAPAAIESAIEFAKKQAISVSEGVGTVGYNVVSRTGKGLAETAGGVFNSSIFTGPVLLGGLVFSWISSHQVVVP